MPKKIAHKQTCQICGKEFPMSDVRPAEIVRPAIMAQIRKVHPEWTPSGFICQSDLDQFRNVYVRSLIEADKGELSSLEKDVVDSLVHHETVALNIEKAWERQLTVGERLADKVAEFGGSWGFIIAFLGLMALWMSLNIGLVLTRPFDPYPFILLNLVLSCLAAIQAPVIMMSQNRQQARDRLRAHNDYQINLKAELEIRQLHEKLDHLIRHQWERLIEIQEVQIELLNDVTLRKQRLD